jgi:hypothetical protein
MARASIELMMSDNDDNEDVNTTESSSLSPNQDEDRYLLNIGPLVDLIDEALDEIGMRPVFTQLFDHYSFLDALEHVAHVEYNLDNFFTSYDHTQPDEPPLFYVRGIPNNRNLSDKSRDGSICSGCPWWVFHWVGAVAADKLLKDGQLRVDAYQEQEEQNDFDKKYLVGLEEVTQTLLDWERDTYSDLMIWHSLHGFVWHYFAMVMPNLQEYPHDFASTVCGNRPEQDYEIKSAAHVSIVKACWHAIGHGVFEVMAIQQLNSTSPYSVRKQLRPKSNFVLQDKYVCLAARICAMAPESTGQDELCLGAVKHSLRLVSSKQLTESQVRKHVNGRISQCE